MMQNSASSDAFATDVKETNYEIPRSTETLQVLLSVFVIMAWNTALKSTSFFQPGLA